MVPEKRREVSFRHIVGWTDCMHLTFRSDGVAYHTSSSLEVVGCMPFAACSTPPRSTPIATLPTFLLLQFVFEEKESTISEEEYFVHILWTHVVLLGRGQSC